MAAVVAPFRLLVVCTANICRSPAAARLLQLSLPTVIPPVDSGRVVVESRGTRARDGAPACDLTSALVGEYVAHSYHGETVPQPAPAAGLAGRQPLGPPDDGGPSDDSAPSVHRAQRLTAADVTGADLVLGLDRSHRAALASLEPRARPRTFTLRQAAALAVMVASEVGEGRLPQGAPTFPDDPRGRLDWLVAELDAARGQEAAGLATMMASEGSTPGAPSHNDEGLPGPLDIPDPHVLGYQLHPTSVDLIKDACLSLTESVALVTSAPAGPRVVEGPG